MKLKALHFIVVLQIISISAWAQWNETFQFDNFNVQNGLLSHIVHDIETDHRDFTWVLTPNGIQRFDGTTFKTYNVVTNDKEEIHYYKNNSGIFIDSKKDIWLHNQFGAFKYDSLLDEFKQFKIKNFANKKAVTSILEKNGKYYFFSWQMLVIWNPETDSSKKIFIKKRITSTCDYGSQGILIASPNGLQLIKNDELVDFQLYGNNLRGAGITCLFKSSDNTIWIGTYNKGIYQIKNNAIQHIKNNIDYKISELKIFKNKVVAGTDGYGMLVFDLDGHEADNSSFKLLHGLPINKIDIDQYQRLWISSFGRGLFLHNPYKPYLRKINIDPEPNVHAQSGFTSFTDSKKRLWLGTDKGIVIRDKNGKKKFLKPNHFIKKFKRNESFVINNIQEDRQGNFWVSSYGFGLFYINGNNFAIEKTIKSFTADGSKYSSKFIIQTQLYGSKMWFKLVKGLAFEMDLSNNSFTMLPINSVSNILYNSKSATLYVSNHDGIFAINRKEKKLIIPLKNRSVTSIVPIDERYYLIGTESNGLFRMDTENKTLDKLNIKEGKRLPNHVTQILNTGFKEFIVMGDNSIISFTYDHKSNTPSETQEIVKQIEAHQGASSRYKYSLIIGSYDGFYQFPLNFKEDLKKKHHIFFNELEIDGKKVSPINSETLTNTIEHATEITLNHPDKSFKLEITSTEYDDDNLLYSWKLDGFDNNFNRRSNTKEISYQNLPYGTYDLKIKLYSGRKIKELSSRSLIISVKPPFWKTTWAYLFYLIGAIILLYLVYQWYHDNVQQKHLKARNAMFAEIAHELRTPLTLMQGPLQKLEEDTDLDASATRLMSMVRSNLTRLNKRITQLLDYERVNEINEQLHIKTFDLLDLTKVLIRDFEPLIQKKGITIAITTKEEKLIVTLDFDKVEKIIYNLISNAIKYSKEKDTITITLEKEANSLKFNIQDHGIGIPKGNQKHIFKRFYRAENVMKNHKVGSGIGLVLSYKYTAMMSGKLHFESEENQQTTFFLELPLKVNGILSDTVPSEISHYGEEFSEKDKEKYDYRIAVAEDNAELRAFIKTSLSDSFTIEVYENGKECYEALLEHDFDLVLSDVMMPIMNGYELCDKIKGNIETSHLPIILLTALNASMYKAEGYMHGADHYVIKPFDIRMLKYRIISLIENRKSLSSFYQNKIQKGIVIEKIHAKTDSIDNKFLLDIDELIDTNLMNPNYNVMEICKDIGMSRPVLYRKLKALTKLSPKEYIQHKRLNHAKKLLIESTESISTIAYESGYSDPKYFSTVFKKQFGMSPSEFLKQGEKQST
ncbi:hybrid sensor histidine kinase/response regulator transcription factor [Flammeovirga kamogawensis]|uniref:histidine kinase n=1 Tax=Flammeovirga kamogawensis TaxID=373891 RepID=A0ABX8H246_9BACT|nr:hybrid sensor histidine kinase/response regulator transcription factor [Flammeovirga kamogawensis]MBB6462373.1 AraC-like DNA-binding protein/ligand-binding sensor domain-containing protein/anti-sigma regulatory factor (Ser/Thr protein kinase) [Flammeovirga kamogawensis]QWG09486.1 helix-turn-helix domain-containing protein [Flammeovirga kamogawensis]TRX65002.1 helix-turn-helix domain-containing protein [Flammeovirga kamogawensis]